MVNTVKREPLSQRQVLVLNKCWQPIRVVTLEKALTKLCNHYKDGTPKAKIIDCVNDFRSMTWDDWRQMKPSPEEEAIICASTILRVPTVIQVLKYDKLPAHQVRYNRRTIYKRDNNTCQYCGQKKSLGELNVDHVKPRCQGGKTEWTNIVVSCVDCNAKKAGRTPEQAGMTLIRKPHKPKHNYFVGDIKVKDWTHFISEAYYNVELENDMG